MLSITFDQVVNERVVEAISAVCTCDLSVQSDNTNGCQEIFRQLDGWLKDNKGSVNQLMHSQPSLNKLVQQLSLDARGGLQEPINGDQAWAAFRKQACQNLGKLVSQACPRFVPQSGAHQPLREWIVANRDLQPTGDDAIVVQAAAIANFTFMQLQRNREAEHKDSAV